MSDTITRLNAALEGRYHIEREVGRGGMATVYLARDLRHERSVALKVLKPELAAVVGSERFLAEIKTTAGLQHPHILALHDSGEADGFLFYVMPYVEGETLRERLDRDKQLPVDEALALTVAVANALQVAHEAGVIHRDIKPGNILLSRGEPLVADFGIALAVSAAGGGRLTETGLSLGTPYYMSPEQASADREATAASDVYSLGCVLYEMLVGEPPYTGASAQAVLAKILMDDAPTPTRTRSSIPAHVDAAIRRSLEKLPADRFSSAEEMVKALRDPSFRYGELATPGAAAPSLLWKRVSVGTTVVSVGLAAVLAWALTRPAAAPQVARFSAPFEAGQLPLVLSFFELTADGSSVIYSGPGGLWQRRWSDLDATPVRGTQEAANWPVLSPDETEVAFTEGVSAPLLVTPLAGGPTRTLVEAIGYTWDWSEDGYIYFSTIQPPAIGRVPAFGGGAEAVEAVTELLDGETGHLFFGALPGGRMAVFQVARDLTGEASEVWVLDLDTKERRLLTAGHSPRYVSGHLFFVTRDGALMAQRFDPARAELSGPAVPVAEGLAMSIGVSHYGVAETGTLIYRSEGDALAAPAGGFEPVWVSRSGEAVPVDPGWSIASIGVTGTGLRISPDDSRVAVAHVVAGNSDVWVKQLPVGPFERLTSDGGVETSPFWNPDGAVVGYSTLGIGLQTSRSDGTGSAETLIEHLPLPYQGDWSSDGEWIVFRTTSGPAESPANDILGFRPGEDRTVVPLVATAEFSETSPRLSPNGRWLAYTSDLTGRNEVYVRPFPNVDSTRITVSRNGGIAPVWASDGDELFFVDESRGLVAAQVDAELDFRVLGSETLFTMEQSTFVRVGTDTYDVAPDGERFLMLRIAGSGQGDLRFIVVQNVFEEIRARTGG